VDRDQSRDPDHCWRSGHTIAGAAGGTLGGLLLQTVAATVITSTGAVTEPTVIENAAIQVVTGAGACVTLIVGLAKHGMDQQR
jgi:hypothetical protein